MSRVDELGDPDGRVWLYVGDGELGKQALARFEGLDIVITPTEGGLPFAVYGKPGGYARTYHGDEVRHLAQGLKRGVR